MRIPGQPKTLVSWRGIAAVAVAGLCVLSTGAILAQNMSSENSLNASVSDDAVLALSSAELEATELAPMSAAPVRCSYVVPENLAQMSLSSTFESNLQPAVFNLSEALERITAQTDSIDLDLEQDSDVIDGMSCDGFFSCSPMLMALAEQQEARKRQVAALEAAKRPSGPMCTEDDPECWLNPEPVCPCSPQLARRPLPFQSRMAVAQRDDETVFDTRFEPGDHPVLRAFASQELLSRVDRPPRA